MMERKYYLCVCYDERPSSEIIKFVKSIKKKKMKYLISLSLIFLSFICPFGSFAQTPEYVLPVIVSGKDSAWYAQQAQAWEKVIQSTPHSEEAWRNLCDAKYYLKFWFKDDTIPKDSSAFVLNRMEKAIPGTFTYNYCRCKVSGGVLSEFGERALDLLPAEIDPVTIDGLLGYLWRIGAADGTGKRAKQFNDLLFRQYANGYYPDFALRYSYNQLEGLPENAIYIGRGDLDLFPKIMMQRAMNVHQDKVVVVSSFMCIEDYTDSLCKSLGIPPFKSTINPFESAANNETYDMDFIKYLSQKTGRPIYLEPSLGEVYRGIADCLYREGLLLKYSINKYDNWAASKKAIHKYHFEYLKLPKFRLENYWKGSEKLQTNYVVLLADYVRKYKQTGNTTDANWLEQVLRTSIENTQLPESSKATYIEYLEQTCK